MCLERERDIREMEKFIIFVKWKAQNYARSPDSMKHGTAGFRRECSAS